MNRFFKMTNSDIILIPIYSNLNGVESN
jgi:hypothetical protein